MVRVAAVQILLRCGIPEPGPGGIVGCRSVVTLLGSQGRIVEIDDNQSSIFYV
jgi:hypothetical protein